MATALEPQLMTAEQFLALPDDGKERWLIRGELRERTMTVRNRFHSMVMIAIGALLKVWRDQQPEPRGIIVGGEAGIRLGNPVSVVGVDVAYISAEVVARQTGGTTLIEGVPTLIVEILSPNDTQDQLSEKRKIYLAAGVPLIWYIDPEQQTITILEAGQLPRLVNREQTLSAEPHLPGFSVEARRLFD